MKPQQPIITALRPTQIAVFCAALLRNPRPPTLLKSISVTGHGPAIRYGWHK